jgi:hypothetical protein
VVLFTGSEVGGWGSYGEVAVDVEAYLGRAASGIVVGERHVRPRLPDTDLDNEPAPQECGVQLGLLTDEPCHDGEGSRRLRLREEASVPRTTRSMGDQDRSA